MSKIQRVELQEFYDISIFCPFCGQKVVDMEAAEEGREMNKPCPHTLFIAHDEAFEFRSQKFNENLGVENVSEDDIELPETGIDGFTDKMTIADSVKFAAYVGAPSGFGSYVGFAPQDD